MKALTIQQPYAWAMFHGKGVENRTQVWKHRGPLAIHAGRRGSERGSDVVPMLSPFPVPSTMASGAILGVVQVVDCHRAMPGCCDSPWAEQEYVEHPTGRTRRSLSHLVCEDAVEFEEPIPAMGRLGLWNVQPETQVEIAAAMRDATSYARRQPGCMKRAGCGARNGFGHGTDCPLYDWPRTLDAGQPL